jgi:DNA (cytosine-5)-methyltransferase 1
MRFGSVCSGIEAASVAWEPLGWKAAWLSEIEPFPSAVLAHHYPDVPNLGDMTALPERIASGEVEAPDLFCGGTPCQAFSVAGSRKSLDDARGNLSLTFCEIANAIDTVRAGRNEPATIIFWENVPGVLSTKDNAFGCFLAGLAGEDNPLEPPRGKWTNAGYVLGPKRAIAWRVFDAQYFGVAQRRRRVFVVASARDDFDSLSVLFEFDGLRRDTAPSREAGQSVAGTFKACASSGGWSNSADHAAAGFMQPVTTQTFDFQSYGEYGTAPVAATLSARDYKSAKDLAVVGALACNHEAPIAFTQNQRDEVRVMQVAGALAAEPGMKQQTFLAQPIAFHPTQNPISSTEVCHAIGANAKATAAVCEPLYNKGFNHESIYSSTQETNARKILRTLREAVGEEAFAKWGLGILDSLQSPQILRQALHGFSIRPATFSRSWVVCCALGCPIYGSGWLLQSLRQTGCEGCPPQGWEPPEQLAGELGAYLSELSQPGAQAQRFMCDLWSAAQGAGVLREALSAVQEMGRPTHDQGQPAHRGMQVRRLTPEEAEFLQGFPRGYTAIPWRKKEANECPDGPRYKALGNSWAVPVVRWIGKRIQLAIEVAA